SGRYARLYRDANGKLCALKKTPDEVMNARARMILNLNLKTLTMNGKKNDICPNLLNTISQNKSMIDQLAKEIQNMNAYHQCSGDVFEKMLETGSVVSMDQLLDPLVAKNDKERLKIMWDSLSAPSCEKPNEAFSKLMDNYNKADGVANFLKACVGNGLERILRLSGTEKVVSGIPIKTLRLSVRCFKDVGSADSGSVPSALQQEAQLVKKYMEKANDSTLVYINAGGLGAESDAKAGTNTTVFSILGGNKEAINEYALKGETNNKGCIIEIPKECVSYVSPYAILLDANDSVQQTITNSKNKYAVVGCNNGIELEVPTGIKGKTKINTTGGLIAFADHPFIDGVLWASSSAPKCEGATPSSYEGQISQVLRSRKLDPSNKNCATVLAIYMFCQYVILNNGNPPNSADQVLETSYQTVGSHACMEGHSPGEIPLGGGGIERVLMIGYDTSKREDNEVINAARAQGLKVKCIDHVPKTRAEFIKTFEGCT
ncbi:MAG: hypothetical protein ACI4PJ_03005, partial [Acutalibacteraceae bacterium]